MGSPPSYYSTSQKPTELWNKQVSMGGLSPHPRTRVPWSLHSNESNLALYETVLLPNENPVLSPFLMTLSWSLTGRGHNNWLFSDLLQLWYGPQEMLSFWPMSLGTQSISPWIERAEINLWYRWAGKGDEEVGNSSQHWEAFHIGSLFFLTHAKLDQMPDLGSGRKLLQAQLQWPLCKQLLYFYFPLQFGAWHILSII